ncbi:hypothetical protein [Campylobacter concisus]
MLEANLNKAYMNFERLHGWHNALFEYSHSKIYKIKRAKFRDDEMSVVSGLTRECANPLRSLASRAHRG